MTRAAPSRPGEPRAAGPDEPAKVPLLRRARAVNLARLNHVFIPPKKPERDRLRRGVAGRLLLPFFALAAQLSREGRVFGVLLLLIAFASVDITASQVHVLFAALVGIFVASFALRRLYRLRACRIEIESAARVAVGEPLSFAVRLVNGGPRDVWSVRVERPFLPWDGAWLEGSRSIAHVASGGRGAIEARATFVERGEHHLDAFEAAVLVPFGLTVGPRIASAGARFLVVPRVANVARVELAHRSPIRDGRSVTHTHPGEGEIAGVRPYRAGDPLKHLHVRTWARTGVPHVRRYVDERADRVAVVLALDASDAPEPRIEAAISLVAGIAARLTVGDGQGLDLLVLGELSARIQPRRGRVALELVLDALATHVVAPAEADTQAHVEPRLASLSTVLLVTADHGPRRRALRDAIERGGVPCRWIEVVDDGAAAEAKRAIEVGPIARGEAVAC